MSIKTVALAGASGSLGAPVLQRLTEAGDLRVRVLRRAGSKATFAAGLEVVDVDFGSVDSIQSALSGQDAVVSTIGAEQVDALRNLVEAAAAAGVKRFLPSEFGSDLALEQNRRLPVFASKAQIADMLVDKAQTTGMTYTFVYNGAFLDWGLDNHFLISNAAGGKTQLVDGGDVVFSTTTLATVADAVYGVLTHPAETENRAVYVEDAKVTQNQLVAWAREAAPHKTWETEAVALDDLTAAADSRLAQGLYDMQTFVPYLYRAIFGAGYGGSFAKTDNALLGIRGKTEDEVKAVVKRCVA